MKKHIRRWMLHSQRYRRGAATIEFMVILPLFFLLGLVVWQLVLTGMAVVDTQAAVRDTVRVVSTSGDKEKGVKEGKDSFGSPEGYSLKKLKVKIEGEEVLVKATTKIPLLFMDSSPFTYQTQSKAPMLAQPVFGQANMEAPKGATSLGTFTLTAYTAGSGIYREIPRRSRIWGDSKWSPGIRGSHHCGGPFGHSAWFKSLY